MNHHFFTLTRFFRKLLDSNVILYFEGVNDKVRRDQAVRLVEAVGRTNIVVSLQVLAEALNRLAREEGSSKAQAAQLVAPWFQNVRTQDITREVFEGASELAAKHDFSVWDALVVASTQASNAPVLLSEDLQDGFIWRDVTVLNPFSSKPHPIITSLLQRAQK